MRFLRATHRFVTFFVVFVTLYLGVTGTLIQAIDLRSIFTKAPASDVNVMALRESFNGPGNFQVITTVDYDAPTLPAASDLLGMMATVMRGARQALGDKPVTYVELRMLNGKPIGQVKAEEGAKDGEYRFDPQTGAALGKMPPRNRNEFGSPESDRNTFKRLHRMTTFGDWALYINVIVSVGLGVLIVTGLLIYWKLYQGRARNNRSGLFWGGGGIWRHLHRIVALSSALFLTVVMASGMWLAIESLGMGFHMAANRVIGPDGRPRMIQGPDPSSPLREAELPGMLNTTLASYRKMSPEGEIKVVRVRYFGGMPQGVIVTGGTGDEVRQLVFNAQTGKRASLTEPGYPATGFPFGWQAHQIAKSVHRGDIIGISGRFMDLLSGFALIYLSVSGIVIYYQLWQRRRKGGQAKPIWT